MFRTIFDPFPHASGTIKLSLTQFFELLAYQTICKDEIVDKRKQAFSVALVSMIWLLASCNRAADGSHDLKGSFYPLDLLLVCDDSTPSPLKTEYAARDSGNAYGNVCVERNSVANAVNLVKIDIHRDGAFRDPVYEVQLYVDPKDQGRMEAGMIKAIRSHRSLSFVSNGSVVAQAFLMGLPKDGVISMGGFSSVDDAKAAAVRFEAPPQHH